MPKASLLQKDQLWGHCSGNFLKICSPKILSATVWSRFPSLQPPQVHCAPTQRQLGSSSKTKRNEKPRDLLDWASYNAEAQISGTAWHRQHDKDWLFNKRVRSCRSGETCCWSENGSSRPLKEGISVLNIMSLICLKCLGRRVEQHDPVGRNGSNLLKKWEWGIGATDFALWNCRSQVGQRAFYKDISSCGWKEENTSSKAANSL